MKSVKIAELKNRLSYYLKRVQRGESILVCDRDRVIARIDRVGDHEPVPESDAAFEQAAQLAPDKADLKFSRARTYLEAKRNQGLARRLLEEYLKSPLTPDDPPRGEAERLLRSLSRVG